MTCTTKERIIHARNALVVEWYTRWFEKPVPKGLRVRVSLDAPNNGLMKTELKKAFNSLMNIGVDQEDRTCTVSSRRSINAKEPTNAGTAGVRFPTHPPNNIQHNMIPLFECTICLKNFSTRGNLTKHSQKKHGQQKITTCVCGKSFEKSQALNVHFRWCLAHRNGKAPSPSGFKGKTSSAKNKKLDEIVTDPDRTREKLKTAAKNRKPISSESRKKMSQARIHFLENNPHIKWFEVNGQKVQGRWEKDVAEMLVAQNIKFNRPRLKYDTCRTYTPDFYLEELDLYIEVKGWMRESDKIKYKKVLQEHTIDIRIITKKELQPFLKGMLKITDLPFLRNCLDQVSLPIENR